MKHAIKITEIIKIFETEWLQAIGNPDFDVCFRIEIANALGGELRVFLASLENREIPYSVHFSTG